MKMRPVNGHVVVRPIEPEETVQGGLYIPESAREKVHEGEVVAIAEDATEDVAVGDRVIYKEYSGTRVEIDDEEYVVLTSDDLVAKYEELDEIPDE